MTTAASDARPPYVRVVDALRVALRSGRWAPGEQLPARSVLAAEYRVAPMTLDKALKILQGEGFVSIEHGRGTFVRDVLPVAADDETAVVKRIEQLAGEVARLEELLKDLYSRTGHPYPHR